MELFVFHVLNSVSIVIYIYIYCCFFPSIFLFIYTLAGNGTNQVHRFALSFWPRMADQSEKSYLHRADRRWCFWQGLPCLSYLRQRGKPKQNEKRERKRKKKSKSSFTSIFIEDPSGFTQTKLMCLLHLFILYHSLYGFCRRRALESRKRCAP